MKKTYTSIILCMAAFLLSAPFGFADGDQATNGMFLKKTSTYDYAKHEGTITMESYVEGIVKITRKGKPADIILAMDVSNSMNTADMTNMKAACKDFVQQLYESSTKDGASIDNRISIIAWGSNATEKTSGFVSILTGKSTLDSVIDGFPSKGNEVQTLHGKAFDKCREVMQKAREESNHYVVYLTDDYYTNETPRQEGITSSKVLKESGTSVYVICYGLNGRGSGTIKMCRGFGNAISSNYPHATKNMQDVDATVHDFYAEADNGSTTSLKPIFQTFVSEIIQGMAAVILKETTIVDYINNDNFMLPEGMETDVSKIKLYVQNCTSATYNPTTLKFTCTFGPKEELTESTTPKRSDLTVELVEKDGNQGVKVSGFNLSENWCGLDFDDKGKSSPHGKKLFVEIPYVFKGSEDPGELETNTPSSGIYEDGKEVGEYNIPKIEFCNLKIVRQGLDKGESAIFIITEKDSGKFVCRLTLGGTGKGDVSATIKGLPAGQYTVKETSWNWAYHINEVTQTSSISGETVFTFTGSHRTGEATTPQHHQNHDEKFIKNKMHFTK